MLNIAEDGNHTAGCPGMGRPHTPELIMYWFDVCNDPTVHNITGGSTVAANLLTHRDQLMAVWIEQGVTIPETVSQPAGELLTRSMEGNRTSAPTEKSFGQD